MSVNQSSPAKSTIASEHTNSQIEPPAREPARPRHPESFRDRFCKTHRCTPHKFADRVFLLALHYHALLIVPLLWPWRRHLFAEDFALIEKVAGAQWRGDVQWKIDRLRTPDLQGWASRRFLRRAFSTQRLGTLMGKVMHTSKMGTPDLADLLQPHQPAPR